MFNSFGFNTTNYNGLIQWASIIVVNLIVTEALPLTTSSFVQGATTEPEVTALSTISQTVILG